MMESCLECGRSLNPDQFPAKVRGGVKKRKFCGKICNEKHTQKLIGTARQFNIPPVTIGAMAELRIALDLMEKGFEVYRPVSGNCSGDLIAERANEFMKIEVRTAYKHLETNAFHFKKHRIKASIVALYVFRDSSIQYLKFPSLEEIFITKVSNRSEAIVAEPSIVESVKDMVEG